MAGKKELHEKMSSFAEDVGNLWSKGWSAFMCCAAQDPSRDDRRERKRAEDTNPFYKSQRRGVAAGAGDLAGKQAGLVGVGIVLSYRCGEAGNGIFVENFVDGPSRDSGRIFPGDQLLAIDKHDVESACIEDLTCLLPGTPGSTVTLELRDSLGLTKTVALVRRYGAGRSKRPSSRPLRSLTTTSVTAPAHLPKARPPSHSPRGDKTQEDMHYSPPKSHQGLGLMGIGIEFEENKAKNNIRVSALLPGGAASQSGQISVSDVVIKVDGRETYGWSLPRLTDHVLGPPGSTVSLTFVSETSLSFETKDVTLTRRAPVVTGDQPHPTPIINTDQGLEKLSFSA